MSDQSTRKLTSITCGGCDSTWTAAGACHCSGCHTTFSGLTLFDQHRTGYGERGQCHNPADMLDRNNDPVCEHRNGMWRYPEMTDAQKAARFGKDAA